MRPQLTTIELLQLASGDSLSIQVYKFIGAEPGKKAYLQANLHGCEIVGNVVINELIKFFSSLDASQLFGEVWLVPVCNPLATNQRHHCFATGRYNTYDGKDWNRIFWDYEKEFQDLDNFVRYQTTLETDLIRKNYLQKILFAFQQELIKIQTPSSVPYRETYRYYLQSLCLDANYVIDIHSSSNQALDYLYCFPTREKSAPYLLFERGIIMNEYDGDAFDEAFMKPWLALEKKLAQLGQKIIFDLEAWTLELGSGMAIKSDSVRRGVAGIKNYLLYKGMLKSSPTTELQLQSQEITLVGREQIKKYYAPVGGMIQTRAKLGEKIAAGGTAYQILSFASTGNAPSMMEIRAEVEGLVFDLATSQVVNQGEYVLSIMEKV